jgi:hypothetical protein
MSLGAGPTPARKVLPFCGKRALAECGQSSALACRCSIRPPGCGKRIINKRDETLVHTGGDDEPTSVRVPVVRRTTWPRTDIRGSAPCPSKACRLWRCGGKRVPGTNLVLFPWLNGYGLARGYFDVVALRRLDAAGGEENALALCRAHLSWRARDHPHVRIAARQPCGVGRRHRLYGASVRSVAAGEALPQLRSPCNNVERVPTHVQPQAKRDRGS